MTSLKPDIIFDHEDFIVINKPAGLLSIPDREQTSISLKEILKERYGNIFTVHRLDKETSGIILFAKNEEAHKYFSQAFEERLPEKYYLGIVSGTPTDKKGLINTPIAEHQVVKGKMIPHARGKASLTEYELLESFGRFSLVQFRIHTGRTHQVRVHAHFIGHPIVCDPLYGDGKPMLLSMIKKKYKLSKEELEERPILARLGLHASQLRITGPDGKEYNFIAELPRDMKALVQQLRKNT